jgi:hypothetical protein
LFGKRFDKKCSFCMLYEAAGGAVYTTAFDRMAVTTHGDRFTVDLRMKRGA